MLKRSLDEQQLKAICDVLAETNLGFTKTELTRLLEQSGIEGLLLISKVIDGIKKDLQSIPAALKEKSKGVNKKQFAPKCVPYVIFGYVLNKISWLYGQQARDNTLQKLLDTIDGIEMRFIICYQVFCREIYW